MISIGRGGNAQMLETERNILRDVRENPSISTRALAETHGVCQKTAWKVLNKNKFHPYKVMLVQELRNEDLNRRIDFCNWILDQHVEDDQFVKHVLFSDECQFYNDGKVNRHNCHYWAQENPHWTMDGHTQQRWKVDVWCGMIGDFVIGPYFIEENVTAMSYVRFINNDLDALLQNVPDQMKARMWFQQDGHPAHTALVS